MARSVELVSACLLFAVLVLLFGLAERNARMFSAYFKHNVTLAGAVEITPEYLPVLVRDNVSALLYILTPFLLGSLIVALAASFVQVGFVVSAHPLNPDIGRISPIKGFKRIFSMRSMFDGLKSLLKLAVVALVAFNVIFYSTTAVMSSINMALPDALGLALSIALRIALYTCALLLVLAMLDYLYQRYEHEKSIRMSKHEIRREYKEQEGDPQIKRRLREMARGIVMSRMFEKITHADAVITNPAHYAVALQYETDWPAPKVVAKGKNYMAQRIIRYAEEHGVPIYEQPELARALYEVNLDEFVPAGLFKTVARVLAHLSRFDTRLKRKLRGVQSGVAGTPAGAG